MSGNSCIYDKCLTMYKHLCKQHLQPHKHYNFTRLVNPCFLLAPVLRFISCNAIVKTNTAIYEIPAYAHHFYYYPCYFLCLPVICFGSLSLPAFFQIKRRKQ